MSADLLASTPQVRPPINVALNWSDELQRMIEPR
jgi:hypothetical protein